MNRRRFFGLLTAAPAALTAPQHIHSENRKKLFKVGTIGRVNPKISLTLEEMQERYFRPYFEAQFNEADRRLASMMAGGIA